MIVYDNLWETLRERNLSEKDLLKFGISNSTLKKLKNNESVKIFELAKICNAYGCQLSDIAEVISDCCNA